MNFPLASPRDAYGRTLVELGKRYPQLVVLDADLSPSTMTKYFAAQFPGRFFDCGIAEQNMMSIAAGLASCGKTVFASTFAIFATTKAFDQVRLGVAQPGLNVKIVATHGGITVGQDGLSHHAIEDLALMASFPGFTLIVPADAPETVQVVEVAAASPGPFYIRVSRPSLPVVHSDGFTFQIGKAEVMRSGQDVAIIACGLMVAKALEAAEGLAQQGIHCRVLNMSTVKPLDEGAIIQAARETGAIVVAEEHLEQGGLGSRVAQVVARHHPVPMAFVALKDTYARSGEAEELLLRYGLSSQDIAQAVRQDLNSRHS